MIPSVFYMLSFHTFLKQKTVKRTQLETDNIFNAQVKKDPDHVSGKRNVSASMFCSAYVFLLILE